MIHLPLIYTLSTMDKKGNLIEITLIKKPFKSRRKVNKKYRRIEA